MLGSMMVVGMAIMGAREIVSIQVMWLAEKPMKNGVRK